VIYFVQREDHCIKIGTTIRLSQRLKTLRNMWGNSCRVLAVTDGGFADEAVLHKQFKDSCRGGEWFAPDESLLVFIANEGQTWDGTDEVEALGSAKMDMEVVDDCRIAAAFCGMSLAEYLSERMRVAAKKDIDEGYAKRAKDEHPPKKKGGKG
jgi:hypothetical protein